MMNRSCRNVFHPRASRLALGLLAVGLCVAACSGTATKPELTAAPTTATVPALPTQLANRIGPIPDTEFVDCPVATDVSGAPGATGDVLAVPGFADRPSLLQRNPDPTAPLLVVFHGQNDCVEGLQSRTDLDDTAVAAGLSVLWLSGAPLSQRSWNVGDGCCTPASSSRVDEYPYITTALAAAETSGLTPARVVAVGISNGAAMAIAAACTHPELFAGVVSVAGWVPINCPRAALSVLAVGGTADVIIGPEAPADIVSMWRAAVIECPGAPVVEAFSMRTTSTWSGCAGDTVVRHVRLEGVGHVWPKFDFYDVDDDIVRFARGEF